MGSCIYCKATLIEGGSFCPQCGALQSELSVEKRDIKEENGFISNNIQKETQLSEEIIIEMPSGGAPESSDEEKPEAKEHKLHSTVPENAQKEAGAHRDTAVDIDVEKPSTAEHVEPAETVKSQSESDLGDLPKGKLKVKKKKSKKEKGPKPEITIFEKRRKKNRILSFIFLILMVLSVAGVWIALYVNFSSSPARTVRDYINAVNDGNHVGAWNMLSDSSSLKRGKTLAQFERATIDPSKGLIEEIAIVESEQEEKNAEVKTELTLKEGGRANIVFSLIKENGEWKVLSYKFNKGTPESAERDK